MFETDYIPGSLEIWQERERQVLYVIGNTFLTLRVRDPDLSILTVQYVWE
jgi:hypothetical protein